MTPLRATTYAGVASVLVAWLASASGVSAPSDQRRAHTQSPVSPTQAIADDVQAQTVRLRDRLAAAPAPRAPGRNPFAFAVRPARPVMARTAPLDPIASAPALMPEPALQLVGVAEQETAGAVVRTALVTADSDELFMLTIGATLGGRYRVAAIGADAIELTDLATGGTRRLALR